MNMTHLPNELSPCVSAAVRLCCPGEEYAVSGWQPQMVPGASKSHPHQQEQPLPASPYVWTNHPHHSQTLCLPADLLLSLLQYGLIKRQLRLISLNTIILKCNIVNS